MSRLSELEQQVKCLTEDLDYTQKKLDRLYKYLEKIGLISYYEFMVAKFFTPRIQLDKIQKTLNLLLQHLNLELRYIHIAEVNEFHIVAKEEADETE